MYKIEHSFLCELIIKNVHHCIYKYNSSIDNYGYTCVQLYIAMYYSTNIHKNKISVNLTTLQNLQYNIKVHNLII